MSGDFRHLLSWAGSVPWALEPGHAAQYLAILESRLNGTAPSPDERRRLILEADMALAGRTAGQNVQAGQSTVAILPFMGLVRQRLTALDEVSGGGGVSTAAFGKSFAAAVADPSIASIVLDFHSPGGEVFGVGELADQIFDARRIKPIVAQINSLAASAAYWVASGASEIVVTSGGEVGSIGVYAMHQNIAKMVDRIGISNSYVFAGKFKTEGHPYAPLSDEARSHLQGRVNEVYGRFTRAVALGRGVSVDQVRSGMGEGRTVGATDAIRMKMADRIGTLDETIQRMRRSAVKSGPRSTSAAAAISAEQADFLRRRHRHRMLSL